VLFGLFKSKRARAVEASAGAVGMLIDGIKIRWFGRSDINLSDISNVLYDSYAQGFLYGVAETNTDLVYGSPPPRREKGSILLDAFSQAFKASAVELKPWFAEMGALLSSKDVDTEFRRGAMNGVLVARFIADPTVSHEDEEIQALLNTARSMPEIVKTGPRNAAGWLITELWYEELERLKTF
jgi:hypothetical protein